MTKLHQRFVRLASVAALGAAAVLGTVAAAQPLVTAEWLRVRLDDPNLVVIDLRSAEDYATGHIPGAVSAEYGKFGWRETVDDVVGMLPPLDTLNGKIASLGITPQHTVVLVPYGDTSSDVGAATRVYWSFKVIGHETVSLLDGGQHAWRSQDLYNLQSTPNLPSSTASYPGVLNEQLVIDTAALLEQVNNGEVQPIDARIDEQWEGKSKHPKALSPGSIPDAVRLPQTDLVDPETRRFISAAQVIEVAKANGWELDGSKPLISYCNTGHWASVAWFALTEVANVPGVKLYDGSMVAWTQDTNRPLINVPSRFKQILDTITS